MGVINHPIVKQLAENFLLRLRIVQILKYLYKIDTHSLGEEDRRIVNWVISNGYDNWPTGVGEKKSLFKGKKRAELNSKTRKITLSLNKVCENQKERESEHEIEALIMDFGRVTSKNEIHLHEHLEEMNKKVEVIMGQRRKRHIYSHLQKRIQLFDTLVTLELEEVKRTVGLPRSWTKEDDEKLIQSCLENGINATCVKYDLTDETIVRRLEALTTVEE